MGEWMPADIAEIEREEEQAGVLLCQAQLKLELELSFTWFKICCIKLINKNHITDVWQSEISNDSL